jgi:hypothetical protein
MIVLTQAQLDTLGEQSFVDRFRALLRETYPEQARTIPARALDDEIRRQVRVAAGYGIVSEQAAAVFLMTAWILGPGFDTKYPAVSTQLKSGRLDEQQKARWLESFTVALLKVLES